VRHDRLDGRRHEKRLDAHVNQPRESARGVVRMQRGKKTSDRSAKRDGDFRRLVSRISPTSRRSGPAAKIWAQTHREVQPDVRAHGDLVDAFQTNSTGSSIVMMRYG